MLFGALSGAADVGEVAVAPASLGADDRGAMTWTDGSRGLEGELRKSQAAMAPITGARIRAAISGGLSRVARFARGRAFTVGRVGIPKVGRCCGIRGGVNGTGVGS